MPFPLSGCMLLLDILRLASTRGMIRAALGFDDPVYRIFSIVTPLCVVLVRLQEELVSPAVLDVRILEEAST